MTTTTSSVVLINGAVGALARQWTISPAAATAALTEVADELEMELDDLASLVLAALHQRIAQGDRLGATRPALPAQPDEVVLHLVASEPEPRRPALRVVGEANAWALRPRLRSTNRRLVDVAAEILGAD